MNSETIIFKSLEQITEATLASFASGYSASIMGEEGSGVTKACRHIRQKWDATSSDKKSLYLTAYPETDTIKLVQFFASRILNEAMPSDWRLHVTSHLMHMMGEMLRKSKVGLIILDRAELAPRGFIDSMFTMCGEHSVDDASTRMLLGIRKEKFPQQEFDLFDSFSTTQIASHAHLPALELEEIANILIDRCRCLAHLPSLIQTNDGAAITALVEVRKLSRGNFRRLDQFASILDAERGPFTFTAEGIRTTWGRTLGAVAKAA